VVATHVADTLTASTDDSVAFLNPTNTATRGYTADECSQEARQDLDISCRAASRSNELSLSS
jgi:hypothetical protein